MIKHDIFITATGTDIGKTFVSALILKSLINSGINAAYFKAAMSGGNGDSVYVKKFSGTSQPLESMCPYIYDKAVSPHLAAKIEGNPVEPELIVKKFNELKKNYDLVIVEGSGGILCPIRFDDEKKLWLKDIIKSLGLNCLLVADSGLGTINYVGLTSEYLKANDIKLEGIIFNRFQNGNFLHEDNLKMCEYFTGSKVIACVGDNDKKIIWR